MKTNRALIIVLGIMLAGMSASRAATYTIVNAPGWNLIANQLDSPNGNNIRSVIPSTVFSAQVIRFNRASNSFDNVETFTAAAGWLPGTTILNPGDGLYFFNPSTNSVNMVFNGNPHVPTLPLNLRPNLVLVARQTNDVANVTNILGFAPPNLTVVYRFNPGPGRDPNVFAPPHYTIYALKGGVWLGPNGPPNNIRVGESVWITTNGTVPVLTSEPKSQTVCPTNRVVFAAAATGTPPLSYQWFFNGSPIANATTPTYTIPSALPTLHQGAYSVQVSNPLGTTTSSNAVLTVGDLEPPTLSCPTGLTLQCRGPGGTLVGFQIGIADNCDPNPTFVAVPPSGSLFPGGTTIVHVTGFDASGNSNTCSFPVTIVDQTPPSVTCPPDVTVTATSSAGARAYFGIVASDNCDANPSVSANPPSGSIFPIGTTPVTGAAFDSAGNSNFCTFNVTVVPPGCCTAKSWHFADIAGPPPRLAHAMAYDSARGRIVLFGGSGQGLLRGDTWEWDGTSWALRATTGPSPRYFTAMAYDSRMGRTILFGGYDGTNAFNDTWRWDGTSWQQINITTGPSRRYSHAMAYDAARGRTVLFGGTTATAGTLGDTWEFDGNKWNPLPDTPVQPSPRAAHAMTYDSGQSQLLLFGGEDQGGNFFGDTWKWDGGAWTLLSSSGPSKRAFHALTYNDNCDSAVLFGGLFGNTTLSDTWEWNGSAWSQTGSNVPPAHLAHAMAHDSAHGQTVLFGGSGQGGGGDTWFYGPDQTGLQVRSTYVACNDQRIVVAFSAPVSAASAQDLSHYRLFCDGVPVTGALVKAILSDDSRIVWLLTAQPFTRCGCLLIIDGVQDACGHVIRGYQASLCCTNDPCLRGSSGTEFWLTFPGNYAPDATNPPAPQLFIAGPAGVAGTVSMPLYGTWPPVAFNIPPGGVATVTLPAAADLGNANDVVQTNGIHVVASQPVAVYGLNHIRYTTDAFLGLSTRGLGLAHYIMTYKNVFTGVPELNGVQFALAAAQDATVVTILPSANVGAHPAGVPFSLTLMQGQTYQLRDTNDAPADLSGTFVFANQPIAVFGSHQVANIPSSNQFFADYIVEQVPPTETWGNNFITAPLAGRLSGDTFRVMAMWNGTTVTVNGAVLPPLSRGKFHEFQLFGPSQITADKPVLVAQFADSSDFDFVLHADPFMVLVPPISSYSTSYILQTPTTDFPTNHFNLMAPAALVGDIRVDGAIIPAAAYSPVGASGFFTAHTNVTTGPHTLVTTKGLPFGVIAYGWGVYDSYGYPGGSCISRQIETPGFTCPSNTLSIQASVGCAGVMPDLSSQVGNAAFAVAILQDPPAGTLLSPWTYPVSLTIIDVLGLRHPCNSTLTVIPGSGPGLICPPDLVTNCAGTNGQVVTFHVDLCNTNFNLICKPPSGSLFPIGTTPVSCLASNAAGLVQRCTFNVTVECVVLSVVPVGNNLTISWSGGGVLQKADAVTGPWITLSNVASPYRISTSGAKGFLRVKH